MRSIVPVVSAISAPVKTTSEYQGGGEAVAGVAWRLRVVMGTTTEREDASEG